MAKRLSILWIARTCPVPANDGEKLRVFNLLKALAQLHDLTVVFRVIEPSEQAGTEVLRSFCKNVYGVQIARPSGALDRIRWVLPFVFSRYPVSLCTVYFEAIAKMLRGLASGPPFDIVQVEHSSLSIYLDRVAFPGRPARVLTMHNIDYIRNARIIEAQPPGLKRLYFRFDQARFKDWEIASLARYDEVIAMSEVDRGQLLRDCATLSVHVVPNGVDTQRIAFEPAAAPGDNLVFVASMDSESNHDGAMFFMHEVWPLLQRQRPGVRISFVGRAPRPELVALHNGADVVVTGQVDDVFAYYRHSAVAVVPLRSGGGTRLKILEAMAAGTAVVSTHIGCEGLELVDGQDLLMADEPAALAQSIALLLADPQLRGRIAVAARRKVEVVYDWRLIGEQHDAVYRSAMGRRHV